MVNYLPGGLDATFAALADPTRRAILERLAQGESSVTELAEPFAMSLPAISKHLNVLERTGLLTREKEGRVRRCCLIAAPLNDAAEWIAAYRRFWEKKFAALDRYLHEAQRKEDASWPERAPSRTPRSKSRASSPRRARRSSRPGRTRAN
jgi:DNA-binding transcriptional ArsR family regulator